MKIKKCNKCDKGFPATGEYFYKRKKHKDGLAYTCKKCANKQKREWGKTETGKESRKRTNLKKRYNMSVDKYEKILDAQNYVCKICGKRETDKHQNGEYKDLSIDHNHNTGKIRGLLCQKCNRGLGSFDDDPILLKKAAKYIEDNQ